jgi:hypothetical protein
VLLQQLPALATEFGFRPQDLDELTAREAASFVFTLASQLDDSAPLSPLALKAARAKAKAILEMKGRYLLGHDLKAK